MAGKFVELNEAAQMIGVTPEELKEMRSRGEIFGYRDGASWKFKLEEVERVMSERQDMPKSDSAILSANDAEFDNLISGLSSTIQKEKQEAEERDSILLSDDLLGPTGGSPSTIIGKGGAKGSKPGDSDLTIGLGSGKTNDGSGFVVGPAAGQSGKGGDVLGGSGLQLTTGSKTGDLPKSSSRTGDLPKSEMDLGDDELSLGDDLTLDTGSSKSKIGAEGSGLSDLNLAMSDDDSSVGSSSKGISDEDSALGIDDDDSLGMADDISVLADEPASGKGNKAGKSAKGSDVTLNPAASGINLAPSDSGLGLDEPLELGGALDDSLELPEDNDIVQLDDEPAGTDEPTRLKRDDQFMLAPAGGQEDEDDSGSQVIALEDSSFDQDAATMLRQGDPAAPALVPDDPFAGAAVLGTEGAPAYDPMGGIGAPMPGMAPGMVAPGMAPTYAPAPVAAEIPYSIWNVLSLMIVAGVLALTGMLMVDVMHNMWQFDSSSPASTQVMDVFIGMFGLDR